MSTNTTWTYRGRAQHAAAQASLCVVPSHAAARGTRGMADLKAGVLAVPTFGPGSRTWSPPTR